MYCCRCQTHVSDCTCPNIDERLQLLRNGGIFLSKWCNLCNKHYSRCNCPVPSWRYDAPDGGTVSVEDN